MTLSILLSKRAEDIPRKICIKFEGRRLTYAEMNDAVSLTAGGLSKIGLNVRDRAAILMENSPEYIIAYFAILRAGGIAVPLNTFLTPHEISYILKDSGCKLLIYSEKFFQHIEKIRENLPGLIAVTFEEIPQTFYKVIDSDSPYAGDDDEIAVLLYTSGTTGFPKGAMLSHKNLLSNAASCQKAMDLSPRDRVLLFLPLFHSFSFTVCVILPIYSGFTIVLLPSVKPFSRVIKSILKERITLFVAIPAVYNILSKKRIPAFLKYIFRFLIRVRLCVSGAAALPEETLLAFEKRFKIPLLEGYGLTEASPVVSVNPVRGARKPGSVGLPLPGVEVAVVSEDNRKIASGETGELIVRGPNVMKGYFNKDEETNEIIRDGWLYTGDMAKIDDDGYIYIVDRKKDIIIVDGMNIYPREVEDIVVKHPSVEECAMVGIRDGSEIPVLFIKRRNDTVVSDNEITNFLKEKVAKFKLPRRIIFVDDFSKTATGKIKKTELRKWKIYV